MVMFLAELAYFLQFRKTIETQLYRIDVPMNIIEYL